MATPDGEARSDSTWSERLIAGKTAPQRALKTAGAAATALLAIAALVAGAAKLLDDRGGSSVGAARADAQVIENQSDAAGQFVRMLLDHDGRTIALNHQVLAPPERAHVILGYGCTDRGCNSVKVESPQDQFRRLTDGRTGVSIKGCFRVASSGHGYGIEGLEIELSDATAGCPD